jgi:TRAP-type C4-dicarboxylate transport system permease small subunit
MKKVFLILDKCVDYLVAFLMCMITVIGGIQVFCRYILNLPLTWSEELSRYLLIWLVFLAMGVGFRRHAHIGMNVMVEKFSLPVQKIFALFSSTVAIVFGAVIICYTLQLIQTASFQTTAALGIPIGLVYYGMVFGGLYTSLVGLRFFVEKLFTKTVKGGEN